MWDLIIIYLLHVILFLSVLIFQHKLFSPINSIVHKISLKTTTIICFILLVAVSLYYLPFKWIFGWHTDPWFIEALFLLVTFLVCDSFFLIFLRNKKVKKRKSNRIIQNLERPYFVIRTLVVSLFIGKIVLTFLLAIIPYGALAIEKILPEVRYVDYHLSDNYYFDYSNKKKLLITRKIGFFEKDIKESFCYGNEDIRYNVGRDLDSLKAYNYEVFPKECFFNRGDTTFFSSKLLAQNAKEKCIYCNWDGCKFCINSSSKFRKESISFFKDSDFLIIRCNTKDHGAASISVSGRPNRYVEQELKINLLDKSHKLITF